MSLNDEVLRAAVESKPDLTIRKVAAVMGVHSSTVSRHLAAIAMVKRKAKWIPHDLIDRQRWTRFNIFSNLKRKEKRKSANEEQTSKRTFLRSLDSRSEMSLVCMITESEDMSGWMRLPHRQAFPKPDLRPKKGYTCCLVVVQRSDPLEQSQRSPTVIMFEILRKMWPAVAPSCCRTALGLILRKSSDRN